MTATLPPLPSVERKNRRPVRIWPTPIYLPTGKVSTAFVVTVPGDRPAQIVVEEQFTGIDDAREWARAVRHRKQAVIDQTIEEVSL